MQIAADRTRIAYGTILAGFALLYAVDFFPGLESHSGYYGVAVRILEPDNFADDFYLGSEQPAYLARLPAPLKSLVMLLHAHPAYISLYSLLIKIAGELWLDDRFNLLVYWVLVAFSVWGLERISALFGLNRLERLAIIAILVPEHTFKDNILQIVTTKNYSPTNFAYPLAIWLGYFILKGNAAGKTLALAIICLFTSLKNTWFPAFVSFLLCVRECWGIKWHRIAAVVVAGAVGLFAGYFFVYGANVENAFLFDFHHRGTENSEADPFMETGAGNILYLLLLVGMMLATVGSHEVRRRIRVICIISGLVFIFGGLYYTFAPNQLKIPFLMALAVNRSTWWTQLFGFVVLASYAIHLFGHDSTKRKVLAVAILLFLYGTPWFRYMTFELHPKYLVMVARVVLLQAALFLLLYVATTRKLPAWCLEPAPLGKAALLVPFILVTALYLERSFWVRLPSLKFAMNYGIMGDNPGAKWLGVNEFFRYETEKSVKVLALAEEDYPWRPAPPGYVVIDGSLAIRSARSTPFFHSISAYFNYSKLLKYNELQTIAGAFGQHWRECDLESVGRDLRGMGEPEYIVAPSRRLCVLDKLGYRVVREINSFSILEKTRRN